MVEIRARCTRRDMELDINQFFEFHCGDWQPQDPNLVLLMEVEEVKEKLVQNARCWNCRWSLLFILGLYAVEEEGGGGEGG
ncbi:MAG: hypothetical protein LM590_14825 [Thermofilum sp.]|nr:hypothetical protein [Thermofilum sp.]